MASSTYDEIRFYKQVIKVVPLNGLASGSLSQINRSLVIAINDSHILSVFIDQILESFFSHLASTDNQYDFVIKTFEKLTRVIGYGYRGNAYTLTMNLGLGLNALGNSHCRLE